MPQPTTLFALPYSPGVLAPKEIPPLIRTESAGQVDVQAYFASLVIATRTGRRDGHTEIQYVRGEHTISCTSFFALNCPVR